MGGWWRMFRTAKGLHRKIRSWLMRHARGIEGRALATYVLADSLVVKLRVQANLPPLSAMLIMLTKGAAMFLVVRETISVGRLWPQDQTR